MRGQGPGDGQRGALRWPSPCESLCWIWECWGYMGLLICYLVIDLSIFAFILLTRRVYVKILRFVKWTFISELNLGQQLGVPHSRSFNLCDVVGSNLPCFSDSGDVTNVYIHYQAVCWDIIIPAVWEFRAHWNERAQIIDWLGNVEPTGSSSCSPLK
jgi:hypothetical protein